MSVPSTDSLSPAAQEAVTDLRTLRDMIRWVMSYLSQHAVYLGHGTDNARDEAILLCSSQLSIDWPEVDDWLDSRLTQSERVSIATLVEQRVHERVPVPYLIGQAWFCGWPFVVDERVLIPRSPIAELIQQRFEPWLEQEPARILDLCTGSGCIGIACAHTFEQAQVELLDISFDALAVAEDNIQRHQLDDRVMALQSDLFSAASGQYDLIVSNPPYVDADDMACLPDEYHHEPVLALAAGDDGLDLVRTMLAQAKQYLSEQGVLVIEVGNSWPALAAAYPELPFQWQEFEHGGHGVCVLHARDLDNLSK